MKNKILTLMLGTAMLATSPAYPMEGSDEDEKGEVPVTPYKSTAEILAEGKALQQRVEALPFYEFAKSQYGDTQKMPSIPVVTEYRTPEEMARIIKRMQVLVKQLESPDSDASIPLDQLPYNSLSYRK
jgi:hypothetical protein